MPAPPADAPIDPPSLTKEKIASLATLYDRFAHALDPYSPQRDEAERIFMLEIALLYDFEREQGNLSGSVSIHDFRKAIIVRCRRHLAAQDKPSSI
jgi:hypothetical protein